MVEAMSRKLNWLLCALLASCLAACGDSGGSGPGGGGVPSEPDEPTTREPGPIPPVTDGGDLPVAPKPQPKPGGGTPPAGPRTLLNPTAGGASPRWFPWEPTDPTGGKRPRVLDGVPGGFTNVPPPVKPGTPGGGGGTVPNVDVDPGEGGPPTKPRVDPPEGPKTPGGDSGDGSFGEAPPVAESPRRPLPPIDTLTPKPEVPTVFAPPPNVPEGPRRPRLPGDSGGGGETGVEPPGGKPRRPGEPVPEPSTYFLFGLGAGFAVWTYRRNAARAAAGTGSIR